MDSIFLIKEQSTPNCKNELQLGIWHETKLFTDKVIRENDIENLIRVLNAIILEHNLKHERKTPCLLEFKKDTLEISISSNNCFFRCFKLVQTNFVDVSPF